MTLEASTRRRRILVGAYACEPGKGSEPGAGWAWVRALAIDNDVVVLTRANNRPAIEAAADPAMGTSLVFEYLDLAPWLLRLKKRGLPAQAYYFAWQRAAATVARRLHAREPFDVVHHLTWASDWLPAGVLAAPAPQRLWGPVGGSTYAPLSVWPALGGRGMAREVARRIVTGTARRMFGRAAAKRSSRVLLQNPDGMEAFASLAPCEVVPNVVVPDVVSAASRTVREPRTAVFVGRLVPLKGLVIALHALAQPAAHDWRLTLVGEGPDDARLRAVAARLGVSSRLSFAGQLPRRDVFDVVRRSAVFLFPSTHDAAGFAVAEAVALGVPVVCLDHGGPPTLIPDGGGIAVPPGRGLAARLARALDAAAALEPEARTLWNESLLVDRVRAAYANLPAAAS